MAGEPSEQEPLHRSTWDFSDVDDSELETVFFEEYSLHSITIRKWVNWLLNLETGGKWFLSLHASQRSREDPEWEPELSNSEVEEFKALPFREQVFATRNVFNSIAWCGGPANRAWAVRCFGGFRK